MTRDSVFNPETDEFAGRGLTEWMLRQFEDDDGLLRPILDELHSDAQGFYQLEIRRYYVNIYYRGGNLAEIRQSDPRKPRLTCHIDKRYIERHSDNPWKISPTPEELEVHDWLDSHDVLGRCLLRDQDDARRHAASFAYRRKAMDANKKHGRRPKKEREAQQRMAAANMAADGDYVVCDVEHSVSHPKPGTQSGKRKTSFLDLVAARTLDRKDGRDRFGLSLIELKCGTSAIDGVAGLRGHVEDIRELVRDPASLTSVARELERLMKQKYRLGLAGVSDLRFDDTARVEYIIAVAEHNSRSQKLRDALLGRNGLGETRLEPPEELDVKVAILDESCVLHASALVDLESLTVDNVPKEIFSGTLRVRRHRVDELA